MRLSPPPIESSSRFPPVYGNHLVVMAICRIVGRHFPRDDRKAKVRRRNEIIFSPEVPARCGVLRQIEGVFFYRLCSDMSSRSDRKEVAEAPKPSSIGIFRIVFNIFPFLSGEELCVKRYTISRRWKRSTSKDGEVGDRISVRKSVSQIFLQFWKIWHFRFTFLSCTNL